MTTDKPNPPRYPFVIMRKNEPVRNDNGKTRGFRKKSDADAAILSMYESLDIEEPIPEVARMPMSEDIEIEGE